MARSNIKIQSKIAHTAEDDDEYRLLKHLKNQYSKLDVNVNVDRKKTTNQRLMADKYGDLIINKIEKLPEGIPDNKMIAIESFK